MWTVAWGECGAGSVCRPTSAISGWMSYLGRWRRCLSPRTPRWRTPGPLRGWGTWTRRHFPAWSAGQPHGLCRAPWTLVCREKEMKSVNNRVLVAVNKKPSRLLHSSLMDMQKWALTHSVRLKLAVICNFKRLGYQIFRETWQDSLHTMCFWSSKPPN